ncbi:Transcriptional regulator, AraC family [Fulvivirga imtechensis AK7]|uniref:Transcriptional regulator, AraC family n=1 Tax=Fulvivirga imtechensis AK7 TaxID=1237149 RepID=L8JLX7_9BACT|nr:helix-turn-helix domain-containing protein [Fulvivirga imtechensis]ELR69936.1 Transcriptional regulator, AraC family [Fulvivirga imtechensis AK7]
MEDYNKIIESLGIKFVKSNNIKVTHPFTIQDYEETENTIIILKKGVIRFGQDNELLKEGHALFIPAMRYTPLSFGNVDDKSPELSLEEFGYKQTEYFKTNPEEQLSSVPVADFTSVVFETKVFDTVNFFTALDIPAFSMENSKINNIIYDIVKEQETELEGNQRVVKIKTELLVVETIRHIIEKRLFVEQMATNSTYFKDPRLIKLFKYIKDNLGGELTNKILSDVADVSEDYVGQYFKTLTGINPQDYIEYQRMEHAVKLLRTTKMSIRDIGRACGYKDTAYFCRRFKMMYGIPAGKMRKRETLMNI